MNREIVDISNLQDYMMIAYGENLEGFKRIETKQIYFDSEKSFADFEIIFQRKSDDKFFKGKYSRWSSDGNDVVITLTEVFPKQITTTIYE